MLPAGVPETSHFLDGSATGIAAPAALPAREMMRPGNRPER